MQIEIWSDVVCPFCFIGKKHFEAAIAAYDGAEKIEFVWRSFELDPNAAKSQSIKIQELISKKFGRPLEWAIENNKRLAAQGKTIGIDFNFDAIIPNNSFDAHRLLHFARSEKKQDEVADLLFKAYFSEGKDIAQPSVLSEIAVRAGIDGERANQMLASDEFTVQVRSDEQEAQELGLSGVPAFVINRKYLVSGAQPPEAFLEAFKAASK